MSRKKILFVHNSVPEYRIAFWKKLKELIDVEFLITNEGLEKQIYKFERDVAGLNVNYWDNLSLNYLKKNIQEYKYIILPPLDTLKEFFISHKVLKLCSKNKVDCIYWTEKWEADWSCQPFAKKIKNIAHRIMIKSVASKCKRCIASGSKSAEYLTKIGINYHNIYIAYDSSTSPDFDNVIDIRKKYNIDKSKRIILFMGRLISRKGVHLLIEAALPLLNRLSAVLLICGDGEAIINCKEKAANNKNVIFAGMVQPRDRKNYYCQSDVFVIPSICENGIVEAWGLTVNEALECGTPVIASDIVGAAYDLLNEKNGIIVKNGDVDELRRGIEYLLMSDRYMSNQIRTDYQKYSVNEMAKAFALILT